MLGGVFLASLFVAPAAGDSPESFTGSAAGTALQLGVLGQSFTFGTSTAKATSQLTAKAEAAGQATPVLPTSVTTSEVSADNTSASKPRACETPALPDQVNAFLTLGLACSETTAAVAGGNPTATGSGVVASLGVSANSILQTTGVGAALSGLLTPITAADPSGSLAVLVDSVFNSKTLDTTIGGSTSSVSTDAGKVTSTSTSSAAVIKILPNPIVNGQPSTDPILTITVGQATATAVYDRKAGTSSASVDPALVRIRFNALIAQTLGIQQEQTITTDQVIAIPQLAGSPLETEIKVGHGSTAQNPDGSASAVADGVSISTLRG